jgi:hypothetical protein
MAATRGWGEANAQGCRMDGHAGQQHSLRLGGCLRLAVWLVGWSLLLGVFRTNVPCLAANSVPHSSSQANEEEAYSPVSGGPFPIRSLSPIQQLFFQFTPERAIPVPRGAWQVRFDLVEANILARDEHGDDFYFFDFELTRANLSLQYGAFERLALGIEIPLLYTWDGFLDNFIKGFEDVTGFRRSIRFDHPQNRFTYMVEKDGRVVLQGGSGAVDLGDIALGAKALLRDEGAWAPAIAGRFALKLPTGDHDRALGSGEVDIGLGVVLEKGFGPTRFYLNLGVTIPTGDAFDGAGLSSTPMLSAFLTGEYRVTDRFSLLLQLNGVTAPISKTGLDIDHPSYEILAGFNWFLFGSSVLWQAGLMEDLNNTNRTADFAVFTSWSIFFGHRSSAPRCCKEPKT